MSFSGALSKEEVESIDNQDGGGLHGVWRYKAQHCPAYNQSHHNYIPIAWKMTDKSKHVTALMCTRCFHEVNIGEAFEKRTKL